jgi:hypothetical protein
MSKRKKLYLGQGKRVPYFDNGLKYKYEAPPEITRKIKKKVFTINEQNKDLVYEMLIKELLKRRGELKKEIWKNISMSPRKKPKIISISDPKDKTRIIGKIQLDYTQHGGVYAHSLMINPQAKRMSSLRGLGIGSLLIEKAIKEGIKQYATIWFFECKPKLMEFYKKLGLDVFRERNGKFIMGKILKRKWQRQFAENPEKLIKYLEEKNVIVF